MNKSEVEINLKKVPKSKFQSENKSKATINPKKYKFQEELKRKSNTNIRIIPK